MIRRRLFAIASAVSLLLCAATCGLWVRSYWVADLILASSADDASLAHSTLQLNSSCGLIEAWHSRTRRSYYAAVPSAWSEPAGRTFQLERSGVSRERARYEWTKWPSLPEASRAADDSWHLLADEDGGEAGALFAVAPTTHVKLPYWCPALAAALTGMPAARRWARRTRRLPPGRCPACGYDLRATPRAGGPLLGRCPECGRGGEDWVKG